MSPDELTAFLKELLDGHGLRTALHKGWILQDGELPALRGTWFPDEGLLQIEVALGEGRVIEECFGGFGEGQDRCHDALRNFSQGSLHVLLAALWDCIDENQVAVEDWHLAAGRWKAYIGNFIPRTIRGETADIPPEAFDAVEAALKAETLAPGLHWLRLYIANMGDGRQIVEALLDNEEWEAGRDVWSGCGWAEKDQFYSVRNFLMIEVSP